MSARRSFVVHAAGVALLLPLTACAIGQSAQSPQSHFAFPNSNVIPLGQAEGTKRKLCGLLFINWGSPDSDDQELATQRALEKANGDLLINVRTESQVFLIPMLFSVCTVKVRGTAAKMEVGRQVLLPMNPGAAPPAAGPSAPAPSPAAAPSSPSPARGGCTSDADCKGGRACVEGKCTSR